MMMGSTLETLYKVKKPGSASAKSCFWAPVWERGLLPE